MISPEFAQRTADWLGVEMVKCKVDEAAFAEHFETQFITVNINSLTWALSGKQSCLPSREMLVSKLF